MKWFSTLQQSESFETASTQAIKDLKKQLGRSKADLGLIFVSVSFREEIIDLWPSLREEFPIKNLIGCTAGGVIGDGREIEDKPAISITAAQLPHVQISSFDLQKDKMPSSDGSPRPWRDLVQAPENATPQFLLLSDPFSLDSDSLISGLDFAFPNSVKMGGLASGGVSPDENLLIHNQKILHTGGVGFTLSGDINIEPIVAQGCRPIGQPMTITSCEGNVLTGLDNKTPLQSLSELYSHLNKRDQELLSHSLFLGILTDPFKDDPKQGDYLVRNIIGLDQEKGIMAIGALLRQGQKVQFHLRDANTSHEDLKLMLAKSQKSASGAVLFSCLGRGKHLYGEANHDTGILKSTIGNIPVGGFFCNGEIGPISGKTYLHGYTSSIALFSPSTAKV